MLKRSNKSEREVFVGSQADLAQDEARYWHTQSPAQRLAITYELIAMAEERYVRASGSRRAR